MERESEKGKGMNMPRVWERDNWKKEKINPRYEVGKSESVCDANETRWQM